MEKENSNLIIRDLMGRLLYNVRLNIKSTAMEFETNLTSINKNNLGNWFVNHDFNVDVYSIKPYLRPMSQMTGDEEKEFLSLGEGLTYNKITKEVEYLTDRKIWLDKNCFDYRGLIPMGLALEALEGMYNN